MKFTVDRSKWRCGEHGKYSHGSGNAMLRNDEGFSCCLGFVAEQLGVSKEITRKCYYPRSLGHYKIEANILHQDCTDTELSQKAAVINDDYRLTRAMRERKLRELFAQHGHELKFVGEYAEVQS